MTPMTRMKYLTGKACHSINALVAPCVLLPMI